MRMPETELLITSIIVFPVSTPEFIKPLENIRHFLKIDNFSGQHKPFPKLNDLCNTKTFNPLNVYPVGKDDRIRTKHI